LSPETTEDCREAAEPGVDLDALDDMSAEEWIKEIITDEVLLDFMRMATVS